jgi:hypothetical protein
MKPTSIRLLTALLLLVPAGVSLAQVQTMRPGRFGMVPDSVHVQAENLARDVSYQAGRLRPEEQVKKAGFWGMLNSPLVNEMTGNVPMGVSRNTDVLAILGDAEERKRLREKGLDIVDAIDDRQGGLQAMVIMEKETADQIRSLRRSGTPEGESQAKILLATRKATLAFRGTEPGADNMSDVVTDLDANGRVGKAQYEAQRPALNQICGSYGNLVVTGHSLGGAQAQRFATNCPAGIKEVVTFAAPGIGRDEAETFAKLPQRPSVTQYVATNDVVSAAGGQSHIPGKIIEVTFENVKPARQLDPDSLLAAHSQFMLSGEHKATVREKDYTEYQEDRVSQHYEIKRVLEGKFDQAIGKGVEYVAEKAAEKAGQVVGGAVGGMVAGQVMKQQAGWMSPVVAKCDDLYRVHHGSNPCNGFYRGVRSWVRATAVATAYWADWKMPAGPEDPSPVLKRAAPPVDPALRWGGVPILPQEVAAAGTGSAERPDLLGASASVAPTKPPEPAPTAPAELFVDVASPLEEAAFRVNLQRQRESTFAQSNAQVNQMSDQQRAELHRQQDEGRAALRAGMQSLVTGLTVMQQQQQAYDRQMEAERQAQNARMTQASKDALARNSNRIPPGSVASAGQPGYPVLDPFADRYQQQQIAVASPAPAASSGSAAYPVLDPFATRATATPPASVPAGCSAEGSVWIQSVGSRPIRFSPCGTYQHAAQVCGQSVYGTQAGGKGGGGFMSEIVVQLRRGDGSVIARCTLGDIKAAGASSTARTGETGNTHYWAVITHSITGRCNQHRNSCIVVSGTSQRPSTSCGKSECGTTAYTGTEAGLCRPKNAYTGAVRLEGPFIERDKDKADSYCRDVMAAPDGLAKIGGNCSFFCM